MNFKKGDLVNAAGSNAVLVDVFTNADGKHYYTFFFVKNAMRCQPPEEIAKI